MTPVPRPGLRLSVYLGERDRAGDGLLADALIDLFTRRGVRASALTRGVEGFGIKHRLHTERLLTLSEDLPVLATAIDSPERIEGLLDEVAAVCRHGLITVERLWLIDSDSGALELPRSGEALQLTIFTARRQRAGARLPVHVAAVEALRRHGMAGARVLLAIDGSAGEDRLRARFLARNAAVPVLIGAVGEREALLAAVPELSEMLDSPVMTLEYARICKQDGRLLAEPLVPVPADRRGLAYWQKLVIQTGERAPEEQHAIHAALVRRLRREGAAGATTVRAQWGYSGEHAPHGERFWSIGRHAPVLTTLLDTPENMRRWFALVDEMTRDVGLVTSGLVPALRTAGPGVEHGGLTLAEELEDRSP